MAPYAHPLDGIDHHEPPSSIARLRNYKSMFAAASRYSRLDNRLSRQSPPPWHHQLGVVREKLLRGAGVQASPSMRFRIESVQGVEQPQMGL